METGHVDLHNKMASSSRVSCQKMLSVGRRRLRKDAAAPVVFTKNDQKPEYPKEDPFCPVVFSVGNDPPRLGPEFFDRPCITLAQALLGQVLVRKLPCGTELRGRIVETEAYLGGEDAASHSAGGRRTDRNVAMFMSPGTLYVYQIYGVYYCLNISSQGEGAAVLLRALEPLHGQDTMTQSRYARRKQEGGKPLRDWELCNGPSKLCQALNIDKSFDRKDLTNDPFIWVEPKPLLQDECDIMCATRIGIGSSAGEWAGKPLRFYLRGIRSVSVRIKNAEPVGI